MVTLRATKKVLRLLPAVANDLPEPDNMLGDWFVNRLVVDRQPLLLLVSSRTLLPILAPARSLRTFPDRLADLVRRRLSRLGLDRAIIEAEIEAMGTVHVGPTNDRSVLGTLIDFAKVLPFYIEYEDWTTHLQSTLDAIESGLGETPCHLASLPNQVVWPNALTIEMLSAASKTGKTV